MYRCSRTILIGSQPYLGGIDGREKRFPVDKNVASGEIIFRIECWTNATRPLRAEDLGIFSTFPRRRTLPSFVIPHKFQEPIIHILAAFVAAQDADESRSAIVVHISLSRVPRWHLPIASSFTCLVKNLEFDVG